MNIFMLFIASFGNLIRIMIFSLMKRILAGFETGEVKNFFNRYSGHTLSGKTVKRIFAQVPKSFKSKQKDKMNYEDFVCKN